MILTLPDRVRQGWTPAEWAELERFQRLASSPLIKTGLTADVDDIGIHFASLSLVGEDTRETCLAIVTKCRTEYELQLDGRHQGLRGRDLRSFIDSVLDEAAGGSATQKSNQLTVL